MDYFFEKILSGRSLLAVAKAATAERGRTNASGGNYSELEFNISPVLATVVSFINCTCFTSTTDTATVAADSVMAVLPVFTVLINLAFILTVWHNRQLHTDTNKLLLSNAVIGTTICIPYFQKMKSLY